MSNITIFKQPGAVGNIRRPLSDLTKSVVSSVTVNRIQTNTNGTFRRIVNGEQIGKAVRGEFNAIIVAMLPKVSRTFYAAKYNPDAPPTLPDCWSNNGDVPDPKAPRKQAPNCAVCPQNIDGSGENGKSKACRFQRRVALLLEGDTSGTVYQFNIPAKSLFGKGQGNTHPFESYLRFLAANGESIDYVVTNIAYDLDADTMQLLFTPVRPITDAEYEMVLAAQNDPMTQRLVQITVAEADGARATASATVIDQPLKREEASPASPASWFDDADDAEDADDAGETEQPAASAKKPTPAGRSRKTAKAPEPADVDVDMDDDLAATLEAWATEED